MEKRNLQIVKITKEDKFTLHVQNRNLRKIREQNVIAWIGICLSLKIINNLYNFLPNIGYLISFWVSFFYSITYIRFIFCFGIMRFDMRICYLNNEYQLFHYTIYNNSFLYGVHESRLKIFQDTIYSKSYWSMLLWYGSIRFLMMLEDLFNCR